MDMTINLMTGEPMPMATTLGPDVGKPSGNNVPVPQNNNQPSGMAGPPNTFSAPTRPDRGDLTANTWTPTPMGNQYGYDVTHASVRDGQAASWTPSQADYQTYNPTTGTATTYDAVTGQAAQLNGRADYNPSLVEAASYDPYHRNVEIDDLVSHHLNQLMSKDNDYRKRAENYGLQFANSRGLLNSSIAADAAYGAALDRMLPIAQQDASTYNTRALTDIASRNRAGEFNAGLLQQANLFNSGAENDAFRYAGDNLRFDVNAENQFGLENMDALNRANEFNANAENLFGIENMNASNRAEEFNADAFNRNQELNVGAQNQAKSENAQLGQSMEELLSRLYTDTSQFNAENQTEAGMNEAQWAFLADKLNTLEQNQSSRDQAAAQNEMDITDAQMDQRDYEFDTSTAFNAWRVNSEQNHDKVMSAIEEQVNKGLMSHEAGINMRATFTQDFNNNNRERMSYIQKIALSPDMTVEQKEYAIEQAHDLYDANEIAIVGMYSSFPEIAGSFDFAASIDDTEPTEGEAETQDEPEAAAPDRGETESQVSEAYESILGRKPDKAGLDLYTDAVVNGEMTIEQVRETLEADADKDKNAPETQLSELYKVYFGREPDQSALETYLPMIQQGKLGEVDDILKNSEEHQTALKIIDLYKEILGRDPDEAGLKWWKDAVMEGKVTLEDIRKDFEGKVKYSEATGNEV